MSWDVLSGDFDLNINPESCIKNVISASKSGSIIVFHDNVKSKEKVLYTIPRYIEHFQKLGYTFETL